jgi:hypothetical protein
MRSKLKKIVHKDIGETKIVTKFLLFPKTLPFGRSDSPIEQTKWLETSKIAQEYGMLSADSFGWSDSYWID